MLSQQEIIEDLPRHRIYNFVQGLKIAVFSSLTNILGLRVQQAIQIQQDSVKYHFANCRITKTEKKSP